jgi:hypothetical protein
MKLPQLIDHLSTAHLQTQILRGHAGAGDVVITPHGARVLGLFTETEGDNLFFVNPELATASTAKQFLAGEHVLGGDRVWIAPERGLFFHGDKLADGVSTQPPIDPGSWVIGRQSSSAIRLSHEFKATYFRIPNSIVRGTVERSIRTIPSPFIHAPNSLAALSRVKYVGYEIASSFRLLESPSDDLHFGLWFLIQLVVPNGGYLYVPTSAKAVVTGDYYEPTGPDYLKVTDSPHAHVRFKLDSIDRHKIGIRATEVLGRAAFLSNDSPSGKATLIVRNFLNNPSAHYSDVPLHTPAGTQDSIQSYNHNSGPSGFGELEYHTPGINRAMAEPVVTDTNQVWAFAGARADLIPLASRLLNLPDSVFST